MICLNSHDKLQADVATLTAQVEQLSKCCKELWSMNCTQLAEFDAILAAKDEELAMLHQQLNRPAPVSASLEQGTQPVPVPVHHHKGRAPPVDPFSGDNPLIQFEDWLPGLKWAADWYAWTEQEHLLQLAGHLRSRALQKWNFLDDRDKSTLGSVVKSLQA